jgi:hypothetical protein
MVLIDQWPHECAMPLTRALALLLAVDAGAAIDSHRPV